MLSADFGHLDRDTRMIDRSAAQWVHIDVMDGVFVPNISFGFPVMKPIRRATEKLLDVHLMIVEPEKYVARFVEAGADLVTFHYEATTDPAACAEAIRRADAVCVGGGNTFALVRKMQEQGLVEAIREKIEAGTPYLGANPEGHAGETREQRILEYIEANPDRWVVGLREGCMLRYEEGRLELAGKRPARIFRKGEPVREVEPGGDMQFLMQYK